MSFPVRRVDRSRAQQVEPLGSKPKFWFREGQQRLLFKAEDRGTGEDWAEVVACNLCQLLGLPHVEYELAAEVDDQTLLRPGVVCANMSPPPRTLVLGNQLLLALDPQYPHSQRFKVKQHTVDAVCDVLALLKAPEAEWMSASPLGIATALDVFVGYVLLDAWIANQDRHHENWGAIWGGVDGAALSLAPSFDHGAGLARNLQDTEREERLMTKDKNRGVPAFAAKGRSAFYETADAQRALLLRDAFKTFATRSHPAASIWLDRLRAITSDAVSGILNEVPEDRMSPICRQFTLELLEENRQRLLEMEDAE
jgi:hypothetical protein